MRYFDYETPAREAGISDADLRSILDAVAKEFPGDEMMQELHVLRACTAIRDHRATIDDIVGKQAA